MASERTQLHRRTGGSDAGGSKAGGSKAGGSEAVVPDDSQRVDAASSRTKEKNSKGSRL